MGESLVLSRGLCDALIRHAVEEAPRECCGFLAGRGGVVSDVVRMRNVAAAPASRYEIDPAEHILARKRMRADGREIVGVYHSHPRSAPRPSATDRAEAYYPEFVWVIVSLMCAEPELAAFRLTDGEVRTVEIVLEP